MTQRFGGQRAAHLPGIVCLGLLLASGCGTVANNPTKGSSGTGSAGAAKIGGGAQLGLVWNHGDATLRPLTGVPGSTTLGAPWFPSGSYAAGAFASPTQTALLIDPKGNLQMMALPSTQPATVAQNVSPQASISFAPRGGYAVVFVPGGSSILTVSGLPQAASTSTATSAAALRGATISDAGTLLLATDAGNGSVAITATTASGTRSSVASLSGLGGMSFVSGTEDILLSDSVANTLTRYHSGAATVLASHANGLNQPFAVGTSQDGHWAVSADRGDGTLVRVDLTGTTPVTQSSCACLPTQMTALNGNAVFELAAPGTSTGWMIEADAVAARVLFIPPARGGQ